MITNPNRAPAVWVPPLPGQLTTKYAPRDIDRPTTRAPPRSTAAGASSAAAAPRIVAPPNAPPLVILPGFGNASHDYLAPFGDEESSLCAGLARRGFRSFVVPVERKDWFMVGKMVLTARFWGGKCTTHPGYSWYLHRVKETVDRARAESGSHQVVLVGHSAGGWLARAFVGQAEWRDSAGSASSSNSSSDILGYEAEAPHASVCGIVTLGTPHLTPNPRSKIRDMTGGALAWVNATWPGAKYADAGVKYVAVGSRAVRGDRRADKSTLPGYSFGSYRQVLGRGHLVEGDAVVPLAAALLAGADHVVLDDALHSMSRVRTFDEPGDQDWYGSETVIDRWLERIF